MRVNDTGARRLQEASLRRRDWEFAEHVAHLRAECRNCGPSSATGLTTLAVRVGYEDQDWRRLDAHQRDVHKHCSGELHTMPHVGCILR